MTAGSPDGASLLVNVQWNLNGGILLPLFSRYVSVDELLDSYELAHHQIHGHDPRGLDPTVGPTRLVGR